MDNGHSNYRASFVNNWNDLWALQVTLELSIEMFVAQVSLSLSQLLPFVQSTDFIKISTLVK
jgi:hypothetical protein